MQTPKLVKLTPKKNLLAKKTTLDEIQRISSEALNAAAQALLNETQPQLNFNPEQEVIMFVMDMPPDIPVQSAQVVMAQTVQAKKGTAKTCTIGVCHLIENQPGSRLSAVNAQSPVGVVWVHLKKQGLLSPEKLTLEVYKAAKVSMLQEPKHGELKLYESTQSARYLPSNVDYNGPDHATLLVEVAGFKVKVIYFFKVMPEVAGGNDAYNPYHDKKNCPKGKVWKISVNPNDPSGPLLTNTPSLPIMNTFAGITKPTLVFADLPGDAVGQTIGNTITLDINAAGHGWFVDSTPSMSEEFVVTSNPNEWVAKVGSAAAGKMDLFTVLAHEVGHVYGLPHSSGSASLMSEDLKPGVRHTISLDDLKALWVRLSDSVTLNTNNSGTPGTPFDPLPLVPSLFFGFNRLRLRGDTGQGILLSQK